MTLRALLHSYAK